MPSCLSLARLVCLAFAFSFSAATVRADNWERFRGPNGAGISNDKNIPVKFSDKETVRWKLPVEEDGNAGPIVWANRLFLHGSTADGTKRALICIDTTTGKEVWKRTIPAKKGAIHKLSSYASSTPTTDGEAVYVTYWNGKDNILAAYSLKGDELWQRNFGEFVSQHGAGASPILYKDKLILANDKDSFYDVKTLKRPVTDPSRLFALNKKTGQTVWEMPREAYRACYSAPFILDKTGNGAELIVTSTTGITSYDPDSGKSNWNWKWTFGKMPLRTVASTIYTDGLLLACSGDGAGDRHMVAVALNGFGKEARPDRIWENKKEFPYVTCPLVRGEHVYFVNDSGLAGCYHAKTGKKLWFERIPDATFYASPVLIDGKIYACSEQGDCYVIAADPGAFQQLAKNNLGERIRATPAVADGCLYIRTQYHLYCIGKK